MRKERRRGVRGCLVKYIPYKWGISMKLKVGDKVRHILPDYDSLLKGDYTQPGNWQKPNKSKESIVLGGEYIILEKKFKYCTILYRLIEKGFNVWAGKESLKLSTEVELCPYRIGDRVVFNPNFPKKDFFHLN